MLFAPPAGPPPPSVPEGWKPEFDDRYKQWYFVNLHTGKSQWERPEAPAQKQEELHEPPSAPPPSYEESGAGDSAAGASDKKGGFGSNNPYNQEKDKEDVVESDAKLAARLQAEENARSGTQSPAVQPGAASDYYSDGSHAQSPGPSSAQNLAPQDTGRGNRTRSRSFLSKLMGKAKPSSGGSSSPFGAGGYSRPPPPAPQSYVYPPSGYYGGYAQPQAGYGYSQYPMQGGYAQPQRRQGGMGNAGAAALGVGGGLLGGALLAEAFDGDDNTYIENNYGGDDGDYGGGGDDFGGGDF